MRAEWPPDATVQRIARRTSDRVDLQGSSTDVHLKRVAPRARGALFAVRVLGRAAYDPEESMGHLITARCCAEVEDKVDATHG